MMYSKVHMPRHVVAAACAGLAALAELLHAPPLSAAQGSETVLYTFSGGADGGEPRGTLITNKSGALFGTTLRGGDLSQCAGIGCGTVFELVPPQSGQTVWTYNVLYRFNGSTDGANPTGDLIMDSAGNLYGTTQKGAGTNCGGYGCGSAFELSPPAGSVTAWTFSLLHAFGGTDGAFPEAGLTFDAQGNLLGSTSQGGANNFGLVFRLDAPAKGSNVWYQELLYSFTGGADGGHISGPVTLDGIGNIYGTAAYGGATGAGVIYQLVPSGTGQTAWTQNILYNLPGGGNGGYPRSLLTFDSAGNLYGTATNIAFSLTPQTGGGWAPTTLHAFSSFADANIPFAGLVHVMYANSTAYYGTGAYGSKTNGGAVYKLVAPSATNPNWLEAVIYEFTGGTDGSTPMGGVVQAATSGNLYGTTMFGGNLSVCDIGCGVVYMVAP